MPEQPDSLRAADVDREFVAEKLRIALNEGRLDLSEYDDRLRDAYQARTYGELKGLLADLPDVTPAEHSQLVARAGAQPTVPAPIDVPARGHTMHWVANRWSGWLSTSLILTAIWIATNIGNHARMKDFWPVWFILPVGAILLATTITGVASGEPRRVAEREARKRAEREDRKRAEREEREERKRAERSHEDRD